MTPNNKPKVVIESHIPAVPEELARYFDVVRLDPEEITRDALADADALIVRTRTRCNSHLLAGTPVRFVATATIGTDHIDKRWCAENGIEVVSAPGCNAPAVAQYVMSAICRLCDIDRITVGIVGVGHVGSIVAEWCNKLGIKHLLCDPPRAEVEGDANFVDLDTIAAEADVITFHVPHTREGQYATHHLADSRFFDSLKRKPLIINSARGPVTDTAALIYALDSGKVSAAVIDCWENEPDIDPELLRRATYATPHIAGYSIEGKLRATAATVNALCRSFGIPFSMTPTLPDGSPVASGANHDVTAEIITRSYDPAVDTANLRAVDAANLRASRFETLRNHYNLRREP